MMHEILHVVLQHWNRVESFQHEEFNRACDIVVNSIILQENNMNIDSITLKKYGESMHLAPNGREGHEFSAEEVYHMLYVLTKTSGDDSEKGFLGKNAGELQEQKRASWDNHTKWGEYRHDSILQDAWEKRFVDACEAISIREASNQCGGLPMFAKRMLQSLLNQKMNFE